MRKLFLFVIIGLAVLSCESTDTTTNNSSTGAQLGAGEGIGFYTVRPEYHATDGSTMTAVSTDKNVTGLEGSFVYMATPLENAEYLQFTMEASDTDTRYKAKFTYNDGRVIKDIDGFMKIEIGNTPWGGVVGLLELGTTTDVTGSEWTGYYDYYEVLNSGFPEE